MILRVGNDAHDGGKAPLNGIVTWIRAALGAALALGLLVHALAAEAQQTGNGWRLNDLGYVEGRKGGTRSSWSAIA